MAIGHAADRPCRFAFDSTRAADVRAAASCALRHDRRFGQRLPIAEQPADFVLQPRPIDPAGHAQYRAVRAIAALREIRGSPRRRSIRSAGNVALARAAPRIGIMPAAQFEHHFLSRLVFDRPQFLQHHQARPASIWSAGSCGRRSRSAKISSAGQRFLRQRGAAEAGVVDRDRLAPLDAQVFQIGDELAAVALPGAAQGHLAGKGGQAAGIGRVEHAAGRHQKIESRRFERHHRLGHQHQAIFIRMR